MTLQLAFDVVLIFTLVTCAWAALTAPDLLRSVVLFIAFGLLLAFVWVRLAAPDVALAEAAVGSGLTGALLLSTLNVIRQKEAQIAQESTDATGESESEQEVAVAQDN